MPSDTELRKMANDPALSHWFRRALIDSLNRDPVDAAADAGLLALVLDKRASELQAQAVAECAIQQARRQKL